MKVLLISMVFFAPILAAPRPGYRADLEKEKHDAEKKVMELENKVLRILGKGGYDQYKKDDYTGALETGAHYNGETVNETIKRLVDMWYKHLEPSFALIPGTFVESCFKEFEESGWPYDAENTVSSKPECKPFYTTDILSSIADSIVVSRAIIGAF
ncbi:hypothetical protein QAD02_006319 [Eretmocerus hayati]|uniref:Uncharacterized protein n=1 Tax=Eretmocerus hayati TaxID=131215 RepID=A0ACC2N0X5_9HYME|nr:hypothetical protein QAD02_006319 [Eretmocerus hayati]